MTLERSLFNVSPISKLPSVISPRSTSTALRSAAMSSRAPSKLFLAFILIHLATAATVTLTESPAYASQRSCAIYCFYTGFSSSGGPDELSSHLDCAVDPIENDCFCRPDLQAQADSYLRSCVGDSCDKNTVDINSAVSIYDSYCTSAGYLRAEETAPAQTTSGT